MSLRYLPEYAENDEFGYRLDDSRKGGDIDLLIESAPVVGTLARARIKNFLEHKLQLPIDVLATGPGANDRPFVSIARAQAVRLSYAKKRHESRQTLKHSKATLGRPAGRHSALRLLKNIPLEQVMPTINMFYGILVSMYLLDTQKHHSPHIHVRYAEFKA